MEKNGQMSSFKDMSEILKRDSSSVHNLPEGPASDSPAETAGSVEVETQPAAVTPKVEEAPAGAKPGAVTAQADEDDPADKVEPVDLSGYKTALAAVRGDKRKLKKQWRDVEGKLSDAEKRIAVMEGQIRAYSQMGAQRQPEKETPRQDPQPEKVDFYGNPEGFIAQREAALRAEHKAALEEIRSERLKERMNDSEEDMREKHEDYEVAKAAFAKAAEKEPWLWQKVGASRRPAKVVYEEGRKLLGGDQSTLEAENAKLKAELDALRANPAAASQPKAAPQRPITPPQSNASARGTGNGVKATWQGPRPAESIYGRGSH